jgi:hypothetical protein
MEGLRGSKYVDSRMNASPENWNAMLGFNKELVARKVIFGMETSFKHVGTYNRLILTTGHLSAQMSSGQNKAVICSNRASPTIAYCKAERKQNSVILAEG